MMSDAYEAIIDMHREEIDRLRELVYDAFCEGFNEGKYGTWIVGPDIHPWNASEAKAELEKGKK